MCFRIVCYSLLFVAPPLTCCSVSVSPSTPLGIAVPQTPRRSKAKRKLCLHTTFTWLLWMFLLQLCLYRRDLIKFACAYVPVCGLPAHSSVLVALSLSLSRFRVLFPLFIQRAQPSVRGLDYLLCVTAPSFCDHYRSIHYLSCDIRSCFFVNYVSCFRYISCRSVALYYGFLSSLGNQLLQ